MLLHFINKPIFNNFNPILISTPNSKTYTPELIPKLIVTSIQLHTWKNIEIPTTTAMIKNKRE